MVNKNNIILSKEAKTHYKLPPMPDLKSKGVLFATYANLFSFLHVPRSLFRDKCSPCSVRGDGRTHWASLCAAAGTPAVVFVVEVLWILKSTTEDQVKKLSSGHKPVTCTTWTTSGAAGRDGAARGHRVPGTCAAHAAPAPRGAARTGCRGAGGPRWAEVGRRHSTAGHAGDGVSAGSTAGRATNGWGVHAGGRQVHSQYEADKAALLVRERADGTTASGYQLACAGYTRAMHDPTDLVELAKVVQTGDSFLQATVSGTCTLRPARAPRGPPPRARAGRRWPLHFGKLQEAPLAFHDGFMFLKGIKYQVVVVVVVVVCLAPECLLAWNCQGGLSLCSFHTGKLELIAEQIKMLQAQARKVLEEGKR